jgi:protein-tyrosine phosphatase
MAEVVLRARLAEAGWGPDVVAVDSAGTGSWHVDEPADPRAVAALAAAGYPDDAAAHRARRFSRAWFDRYDLVVALDRGHERDLRRLAPDAAGAARIMLLRDGGRDVPDPYYGGPADFAEALAVIEDAVPRVVERIRREAADLPAGEVTA